jgi:hypothetical protein
MSDPGDDPDDSYLYPKCHPRTFRVQTAEREIGRAVLDLMKKHGLTPIELLGILNREQTGWIGVVLRAERHPEDPSKFADVE